MGFLQTFPLNSLYYVLDWLFLYEISIFLIIFLVNSKLSSIYLAIFFLNSTFFV